MVKTDCVEALTLSLRILTLISMMPAPVCSDKGRASSPTRGGVSSPIHMDINMAVGDSRASPDHRILMGLGGNMGYRHQ